jgi:hypothetical protein
VRELQEETRFHLLPSDMQAALKGPRVLDHPDRNQRHSAAVPALFARRSQPAGLRSSPELPSRIHPAKAGFLKCHSVAC